MCRTAGPSTAAEAVGRDDTSRESAGGARDDSDRGDVTAQLKLRPFKGQIPRGLKPARDDREENRCWHD